MRDIGFRPYRELLMRLLLLVAFPLAVAAADEPVPLLKPVNPPNGSVRLRVPTSTEKPAFFHFAGKVPKGPGGKGELADAVVGFDSLPGKSFVAAKKWRAWGYDVPPNKTAVLPELVIPGVQLAPKPAKGGRDAEARIANVRLEVLDPPNGADTVWQCDLLLSMSELTRGADRAFEPRVYFADRFLELTVPNAAVRRPGTGDDDAPPAPAASADADLVAVSGPTTVRNGTPVFAFAGLNGLSRYKTPEGKFEAVNVGVSSATTLTEGILVSLGTARGCGIEPEEGKDFKGIGPGVELAVGRGKVKELRLGFSQRDLVLRDVAVAIDRSNSGHFVWVSPEFLAAHFKDAVYAFGPDGWRLHGRVKPDLLEDVKTRTPAKKP